MSYILSALRKADRDRKGDASRDQQDWDSTEWSSLEGGSSSSTGLKIAIAIVIALLTAIVVALWILIGNLSQSNIRFTPPSADAELIESRSESGGSIIVGESDSEPGAAGSLTDATANDQQASRGSGSEQQPGNERGSANSTASDLPTEPNLPTITGHLYMPANESLSRIFADSSAYRVGHVFDDGLKLVSVSRAEAVFEWQGRRYEVPLGN